MSVTLYMFLAILTPSVPACLPALQDEELFPLRAPGVNYMQDPSNPCTVHVSLSDLCNALHLGTKGAAQQQQE
jgi:hypothetical protein